MCGMCPLKLCTKSVCGNGARLWISRRIRLTRVQPEAWALVEARNRHGAGENVGPRIRSGSHNSTPKRRAGWGSGTDQIRSVLEPPLERKLHPPSATVVLTGSATHPPRHWQLGQPGQRMTLTTVSRHWRRRRQQSIRIIGGDTLTLGPKMLMIHDRELNLIIIDTDRL